MNHFYVREEGDPFPDPSIFDLVDTVQKQNIHLKLSDILHKADQRELPQQYQTKLSQLEMDKISLFHTSFSSGPSAKVASLVIKISDNSKPERLHLRNYSMEQREFLSRIVTWLVDAGTAYSNTYSVLGLGTAAGVEKWTFYILAYGGPATSQSIYRKTTV